MAQTCQFHFEDFVYIIPSSHATKFCSPYYLFQVSTVRKYPLLFSEMPLPGTSKHWRTSYPFHSTSQEISGTGSILYVFSRCLIVSSLTIFIQITCVRNQFGYLCVFYRQQRKCSWRPSCPNWGKQTQRKASSRRCSKRSAAGQQNEEQVRPCSYLFSHQLFKLKQKQLVSGRLIIV